MNVLHVSVFMIMEDVCTCGNYIAPEHDCDLDLQYEQGVSCDWDEFIFNQKHIQKSP